MSSLDYLNLCRLCLVKDRVSAPIFEDDGDARQIFLKITACLPVKVTREDKLPKKICDECVYKVELCYQFWNTTANAEKQLMQWLGEVNMEDKQDYVLNPNGMKPGQSNENRLDSTVMQQVSEHQNNMNMGMMDNINLGMPMMMSSTQQVTSVPMDNSNSSVQNIQAIAGPSTQTTHDQIAQSQTDTRVHQEEEEDSSEEEENTDDECDGDEGLPIKEEGEEDPNSSRTIEPTTFVNVSLACDEAGPSGLQQQKIADMPEMVMSQAADVDPKTGVVNGSGRFLYGNESIPMHPWQIVDLKGHLYYAFLPTNQITEMKEEKEEDPEEESDKSKVDIQDAELEAASDNDMTYTEMLDDCYTVKTEKQDTSMDKMTIADEDQAFNGEDNTVYACDECNICFPEMKMLQNHQKTAHKETKETVTYKCKFCAYLSNNKSTIYSHVSRKHPTKRVIKRRNKRRNTNVVAKPQEYSCDACEFKCQSRRRLKEHLDRKHGSNYNYDCEYCGKKFKVKSDMRLHIRFKHKEGPIICDVCGKTCSNSNSLYVHQKWAHFKPEYECEICKRRMVTQENLDQHILLQHERRESFVCEECGKSFPENHRLKQHMMTHTGDRPYDCHICGKAFARRTAYRQHLLIHTGKRPYVCDICGKAFTQKPGLIGHRKSHPGDHPPLPVVYIDKILNEFMKKE